MNKHKALYEHYLDNVKGVASKWKPYLRRADGKGDLEGWRRYVTACMLENTSQKLQALTEDIKTYQVGTYANFALPIVRAVIPNLIAMDIVSVQPMLGPSGLVFYLDFLYGKTKGKLKAGDIVFGARTGPTSADSTYSAEDVEGEIPAGFTGDGSTKAFTGTLAYTPIRPGTLTITATVKGVEVELRDDGNGGISGASLDTTKTNSVDYTNGEVTLNFSIAPDSGTDINCTYVYDSEGYEEIPSIDLMLSSSPIVAKKRPLRTRWSLEAEQDLLKVHGLNAESEMVAFISFQLKQEIDREIIKDLYNISDKTSVAPLDMTPPAGSEYIVHKMRIIDKFVECSGVIHRKTKRLTGNWVICGEKVANIVESLPTAVFSGAPTVPYGNGVVYIGTLSGRWKIYRDPFFPADKYLVGAVGTSILDAGYVYLPYIPFFTTPTIVLDDMVARKGMMSRYGKKPINKNFYVSSSIFES